jgi:hypothetical protein
VCAAPASEVETPGAQEAQPNRRIASWHWVAIYFVCGLSDGALSILAFSTGATEVNPFMAWALGQGWFVPAKVAVTFLVTLLMLVLRRQPRAGFAVRGGALIQMAVCLWQLVGLTLLARP